MITSGHVATGLRVSNYFLTQQRDTEVRSLMRLETGEEIRKPADNTGRHAQSSVLDFESVALVQASQDVSETVAILEEVDFAYQQIETRLTRMEELADLAVNDVLVGNSGRARADAEYQVLKEEAREIVRRHDFDGRYLIGKDDGTVVTSSSGTDIDDLLDPFTEFKLVISLQDNIRGSETSVTEGNGASGVDGLSISDDGRYIAFTSDADNLVAGDTNGTMDVFVFDRDTGTLERVSLDTAGNEGTANALNPDISSDGRYVAFETAAQLDPATDTGEFLGDRTDIYVYDRTANTVTLASPTHAAAGFIFNLLFGGQPSSNPSLSNDGQLVGFVSENPILIGGWGSDGNGTRMDAFVYDLGAGTMELISRDSGGNQENRDTTESVLSGDGLFAAMATNANFDPGDGGNDSDIYLRDLTLNTTSIVSVSTGGAYGNDDSYGVSISDDGLVIAFTSDADNLVAGDSNAASDIFVRDLAAGTTERISVSTAGLEANGDSYSASVSGDGRYVVFTSDASNLTTGDTNGAADIFLHDRTTGTTERLSLPNNDDTGTDANGGSLTADVANNNQIAFASDATNMVDTDTNGVTDVFLRDMTGPLMGSGDGDTFELDFSYTNGDSADVTGITFSNASVDNGFSFTYNTAGTLVDATAGATTQTTDANDLELTVPAGGSGTSFTITLDVTYGGNTYALEFEPGTAGALAEGDELHVVSVDGTVIGSGGGSTPVITGPSEFSILAGSSILEREDRYQVSIPHATLDTLAWGMTGTAIDAESDASTALSLVGDALDSLNLAEATVRGHLVAVTVGTRPSASGLSEDFALTSAGLTAADLFSEANIAYRTANSLDIAYEMLERNTEFDIGHMESLADMKLSTLTEFMDQELQSKINGMLAESGYGLAAESVSLSEDKASPWQDMAANNSLTKKLLTGALMNENY